MVTIEQIFAEDNISRAMEMTVKKGGRPGSDGVLPADIYRYWNDNGNTIKTLIFEQKYEPFISKQYEQLNKKGKRRKLTLMCAVDRMISRAVNQLLSVEIDCCFSDHCYSYREGKGTRDAAGFAAGRIENGCEWVAELDIRDYFDTIVHERLLEKLNSLITDGRVYHLIEAFVCCRIENEEGQFRMARGLLQGMPLSPLLSNLFLMEMDRKIEQKYPGYMRYGDDIRVFTKTRQESEAALQECKKMIINEQLLLNDRKSGVFRAVDRLCLGYEFIRKEKHILMTRAVKKTTQIYHQWTSSSLKEVDHHYHIVNDGILTKKDFTLLFENENEKKYLPIEVIDSLSIYSNVIFSSGFFDLIGHERVIVNLIDKNGNLLGRFLPSSQKRNLKTEMEQIRLISDEKNHMKLAKSYQNANIFNIRATLRYYERREGSVVLLQTVELLTELLKKINEAKTRQELMMYEAQARQNYYRCFNEILAGDGFLFQKRTRRPPQDAINAMISFGNTLLYTKFAQLIYQTSLDIRIGLLHSSFKRPENLNLDLADLFKPVLVDRTIFTLVNRKMINEMQDFEEVERGGVYMNARGKRIFLQEFEHRLSQNITINGTKLSYADLMRKEVRKLEEYFSNQSVYKPYKYVN